MKDLLTQTLTDPESITRYSLKDWDLLIRQTRSSYLSARIYRLLEAKQLLEQVPPAPRTHLESAQVQSVKHRQLAEYEIDRIYKALSELETPVILLKGAAYVAANLPAGDGRYFSDIDIMVHKSRVAMTEDALQHAGWVSTDVDNYDEKYYRTWMHEIPPMQHTKRNTLMDLHHAIIPETARFRPDSDKLFKAAVPLEGYTNLYTLCPEDMVLHSATHLFCEGEFEHGLRDLVDIDALLRHFPEQNPKFWQRLTGRARNIDLTQPLYFALLYSRDILGTPIPQATLDEAAAQARSSGPVFALVDHLLRRGLKPNHDSCRSAFNGAMMWMLYVRSHYLRMPFRLLIPHLFHKAVITPYQERQREKEAAKDTDLQTLLALRNR